MKKGSTCFDRGVDCGKCCLEEGWVAVGFDPRVLNKMLIKDRHFWKGVWIVGKASERASKQASAQASAQASKPVSKQARKRASKQASAQASKRASKHAIRIDMF